MFNTNTILLVFIFPFITACSDLDEWENFKIVYKRTYETVEEEHRRFNIFQQNLKNIETHDRKFDKGETSYQLGINKFADVSEEEFRKHLNLFGKKLIQKPKTDEEKVIIKGGNIVDFKKIKTYDDNLPVQKDWRDLGAVTGVKDETLYYNGFGWAFSVAAAVETQLFETIGTLIPLSAQNLIDCANSSIPGDYGMLDFVYNYIGDNGIYTEDEYPYTAGKGECRNLGGRNVYVGLYVDMSEESDIKESVAIDGTVTAVIDASRLASYGGGIIDGSKCSNHWNDLNHSVLIVGYGTENNQDYWVVKNSWGIDWGENGYFRVARMSNNTCGIGSSTCLPIIVHDFISLQ